MLMTFWRVFEIEVPSYSGSISSFDVFVACSTEFKELALIYIKAIF